MRAMPRTLHEWLDYIERQHPQSIDMGLERVGRVAQRMELKRPAERVITVAGTNGKGSTVAFIEAIARAAGWKTGAYTSPHLLAYNERVRIDGADASDADLVAAFEAVEAARVAGPDEEHAGVPLTYFEFGTLAALWLFARGGLDLAIFEVGLGGRLDATNLVDADVAVITTVDLDHQDWLGPDRETIGLEKAGIARPWKPLVLGEDDPPASVLRHAYAIGASAIRAGCDFFFDDLGKTADTGDVDSWRWREVGFALDLPRPALAAPAQIRNAATAVAALRALPGELPEAAYAAGITAARLPGRLQRFDRDGIEWRVDVAHNPQAARELAHWLDATPVDGRTLAVFAALADKDLLGIVEALGDRIDRWHLAGLLASGPRGLDAPAFAQRLNGTGAAQAPTHADVRAAMDAVRAEAQPGDRVLVFGSFHTAAAALRVLET